MSESENLKQTVLKRLQELGLSYRLHEHPAAFTVEDADRHFGHLPGGHSKNLFLRNKKGDRHYLVVAEIHRPVDLKALRVLLEESTLSFASPERLREHLGVTPGSVSPFGLINDPGHRVRVILDQHLLQHSLLNFHPNINTATLAISGDDFMKFLRHCGHDMRRVEFPA